MNWEDEWWYANISYWLITWSGLGSHHWTHKAWGGRWGGLDLQFVDTRSCLVGVSSPASEIVQSHPSGIQILRGHRIILRDVLIGQVPRRQWSVRGGHGWGRGLGVGHQGGLGWRSVGQCFHCCCVIGLRDALRDRRAGHHMRDFCCGILQPVVEKSLNLLSRSKPITYFTLDFIWQGTANYSTNTKQMSMLCYILASCIVSRLTIYQWHCHILCWSLF
jgi:hypothetical protein